MSTSLGPRAGIRRLSRAILLCVGLICAWTAVVQAADNPEQQYELTLRSSVPAFQNMAVTYSPDERYGAITGDGVVYVYNLSTLAETRRIPLDKIAFGYPFTGEARKNLAFDSTSQHLFLASNYKLLACEVGTSKPCSTLRDDIMSDFDLGEDGRIAYVNVDNIPVVLNPRKPDPTLLTETVPANDKEGFTWYLVKLHESEPGHTLLVLSGSITREVKVQDKAGRSRRVAHSEWHTSIFDTDTQKTLLPYVATPVDSDFSVIAPNHHVLLCGPDQAAEDKNEHLDDNLPRRVFDVTAGHYLDRGAVSTIPSVQAKRCVDGPQMQLPDFGTGALPSAVTAQTLRPGWKSPKGDLEIASQSTLDQSQIIYLKRLKKPSTVEVLAGSATSTRSVAFLPTLKVVTRSGVSTRIFDFAPGTYQSFPADVQFDANARFYAYFVPDATRNMWDLAIQNAADGSVTKPGLEAKSPPMGLGISDDGSVALYSTGKGIFAFSNGVSTNLNCVSRSFGGGFLDPLKVVTDPSGTVGGAFCRRSDDDPGSEGGEIYFVVWDLKTLKERARIKAGGFARAASFNWDGSTVVLCGSKTLRVADTTSGKISFDQPLLNTATRAQISHVAMGADGKIAVLAISSLFPDAPNMLVWYDLVNRTINTKVQTTHAAKGLAMDGPGDVAALRDDDIVDIYGANKKRIVQLISVGSTDWLAFSEEGLFDGSANALQWAGFRLSPDSTLLTADLLFTELYTPGLLPLIASGSAPQLPSGIHLSTYLELPGIKQMLQNGDATPVLDSGGQATLCVKRESLFASLKARNLNTREDQNASCPRKVFLSDMHDPPSLVKALENLSDSHVRTPWDGTKFTDTPGTMHILSAAVSDYSQGGLPDIPTAVKSTIGLEQAFATHGASDHVVSWGPTNCGGPLQNKSAAKQAILDCLAKMSTLVKPSDMVILILTGHGGTVSNGDLFRYYAYPGGTSDTISTADLVDALRRLSARRIVVVLDACDSGAAVASLGTVLSAKAAQASLVWKLTGQASPELTKQGVLLIAAATGQETVSSSSTGNPFMDKLVEILTPDAQKPKAWFSYALADEMRKPISFKDSTGRDGTVQPFTSAIGADFQVFK